MKHLHRILVWSLLSIVIQFIGLFYINNCYLKSDINNLKIKKITKKEEQKKNVNIVIPEEAKDKKISFDGKYISYFEGENIVIINTNTGEKKDVKSESGFKITFYKWIVDTNRLIIGEKSSKGNKVLISYFDITKNEKGTTKEISTNDSKAYIDDLVCSIYTGVTYAKVKTTENKCSIYRLDRMKELEKVQLKSYIVGNIEILGHDDKLIYEDLNNKRIYGTGLKRPISIEGVINPKLLGVDEEDNFYIGDMSGQKIKRIFYGNLNGNSVKWNKVDFTEPLNKEDVLISWQGKIYINDNEKKSIRDILGGKDVKYKGSLIQLYNGGFGSTNEGKLIKSKL